MLANFVSAALLAVFLQNSIFERALGINILLYAARKRSSVIGFALGLCYITTLSSIAVWALDGAFGNHERYAVISPVLYILVIGVIYISSLIAVWRFFHNLFRKIKKFAHLAVFNCAVLGALFIGSRSGADIWGYLGYGFGTGLGFLAAGYLLYVAHTRLNSELVPSVFRGMPIMVIYIGILSLALHAFVGYSASA
ncbi:MAG: hypothetical protein LBI38_02930 [Oscillospiraceae bacterium]|nr:hypothetical protein [Oscillospiraceae bacterium]